MTPQRGVFVELEAETFSGAQPEALPMVKAARGVGLTQMVWVMESLPQRVLPPVINLTEYDPGEINFTCKGLVPEVQTFELVFPNVLPNEPISTFHPVEGFIDHTHLADEQFPSANPPLTLFPPKLVLLKLTEVFWQMVSLGDIEKDAMGRDET